MNKKIFNVCNLYVFLWFIMKTQGILYKSDLISVVSYIIIVAISLYYAIKCYAFRNNPPFVTAFNILFAVFCLYGVFNLVTGDASTTFKNIPPDFYLQQVVQSMIPFYAFYAFAKQGMINKKWLCIFSIVFLFVTIGAYYIKEDHLLEEAASDVEGVTNNVGYIFVSLLPLACFWNGKKLIQHSLLAICGFFIIMSMKRGAIITAGAMLLIFFVLTTKISQKKKGLFNILLAIIIIVLGYEFILNLWDTNVYFGNRVNDTLDGYSSQRDYLYSYYWNMYLHDSSIFQYMFGRGADGTIHTGSNYAHNDWLEILINQGVLGISIFVCFWLELIKLWRKCPVNYLSIALGMTTIFLSLRTFFSMSINDMPIYSTCIVGVAVAAYYNKDYMIFFTDKS